VRANQRAAEGVPPTIAQASELAHGHTNLESDDGNFCQLVHRRGTARCANLSGTKDRGNSVSFVVRPCLLLESFVTDLLRTPLYHLHLELGAKMVPFAGYTMPVQYPAGVLKEHLHTRSKAGLFDVSHMGQFRLSGADAKSALERLVPVDIVDLAPLQQRYALFTAKNGGILDDLMVTNLGDSLLVIVNAACKIEDEAHMRRHLQGDALLKARAGDALLALQGPAAAAVMARLAPQVDFERFTFMQARVASVAGIDVTMTRSGYTGEDGVEISVAADQAEALARLLLAEPEVAPIGLGARDSLRLEAGLCLYGHDIDSSTSPIEGSLTWAISKSRRHDGARAGHFLGAEVILEQMQQGVARKRVGLVSDERVPVREGAVLCSADGDEIGRVTSGGFGPTLNGPLAMGYLPSTLAKPGTVVAARVRERLVAMRVVPTPFVPQRYFRSKS
jgi:aminomethyltransferase